MVIMERLIRILLAEESKIHEKMLQKNGRSWYL